ncbi:hypothetical protein EJ08DRAFT_647419 [Tothia fuscella]|uniref:Uncharacterized protein n=1 Tax=Tothia fuscella TaxID=1048955 RepID=A0A9P4NYF4_9PEZI|nr:hypothetical protein EJ08DRAFT_647419 [Tothia fuscella]
MSPTMNQVTKGGQGGSQVQSQSKRDLEGRQIEEHESEASAKGEAGLNLNLSAAVSSVFGGKSKKTTDTAPDGSSHSVEDREGVGHVKGAGKGNLGVIGKGEAHSHERSRKIAEGKSQKQTQHQQQTDHLGLE